MLTIRRKDDRGHFDHGWLNTYHTFSFGDYHDAEQMGYRSLRVMNEDRVLAGQGFGTHGHKDMEIVSYVLEGALEHRDSLGNGSILHAGDFQRMTAGTGVRHSEFNPSQMAPAHFYQIWLLPERAGLPPGYEEKRRSEMTAGSDKVLRLVASRDGRDGSLTVHQDANIFLAAFDTNGSVEHIVADARHVWIQVLRGNTRINDEQLTAGDGVAVSEAKDVTIHGESGAEIMLFDLA